MAMEEIRPEPVPALCKRPLIDTVGGVRYTSYYIFYTRNTILYI